MPLFSPALATDVYAVLEESKANSHVHNVERHLLHEKSGSFLWFDARRGFCVTC